MQWLVPAVGLIFVVAAGVLLGRRIALRQAEAWTAGVRSVAAAIRAAGVEESKEILRAGEIAGREEALAKVSAFESFCHVREAELDVIARRLDQRDTELAAAAERLTEARAAVEAQKARAAEIEAATAASRAEVASLVGEARGALEREAGQSAADARAAIVDAELEDARAHAAQAVRAVDHAAPDEATRAARRLMGIAVGRFSGHYLTERLHSLIPLPPGAAAEAIIGADGAGGPANLAAIGAVAGVTLTLVETRDAVRLEGLDGVGREVARRCLARLQRDPRLGADAAEVERGAREVSRKLDRELDELGHRAFHVLEIPNAHAEIVRLVGRLNYRTSYTQNQWKHAIEAGFLCGMMAEEMGLDLKLARRAALMHDIGKALTHELDGSHAVIGADYARRLGEAEIVANAIGAHHTDEPFNSPYAYLVAAADAMSGARPGARRQVQMDESYASRLEGLERITRGFRGITEAFAVQGGREVRVYVQEDRVDDLAAVELSTAIAKKISQEMRFPGQIRVTVIRELRATEIAS
ncbi:MAG TPA: Rnase Y domain-containing protein [Polyangia bacterium]|nr:Rnase Y domain-containing protein [Polyangia bacterium]